MIQVSGTDLSVSQVRMALTSMIYDKGLRLASFAKQQSSVGEIVNHMSVDVSRIADVIPCAAYRPPRPSPH